ncbi:class I SAM-dependent methyltransferase [Sedimenticola selenatireducens]|uniref:Class I SAM-dependent methyltransferase n=1 Tax=Sedimenticola selenatireducens TaxID=191960 RepID=A0A557SFY2_9GAMM|nr:class I SAM-dependent methyltransferase [Sedimenticola selenatireducens]TVO76262.1 class I SAM-dependent methyltransferase [Sedimenticola selenatireducens]TVT61372.1 MAG: class I SAM-dependent methyltransferase [Sedimenticola selenatireducens]
MKRVLNRITIPPSPERLRRWFSSTPGKELLAQEQIVLERLLGECFGYYLLQVGCIGQQMEPLSMSRIKSQIVLLSHESDSIGTTSGCVVGDPLHIPLAADSVDAVLLMHTLDFTQDPHQLLREVERILIPEGHLIIAGFNPFSLWGLWQFFRWRSKRVPWCGHFISSWRVHDWLSLLGFDVREEQALMFRPPLQHDGLMQRLDFMERIGGRFWPLFSGAYVILAVKRVSRLTPIKPAWKLRPKSIRGRVVEPTANNMKHGSGD